MTWIATVTESDAEGELKKTYARIRGERGRVSRIFEAQSLDPRSLAAHLDLYLGIMFGSGGLSRPEREMIAVAVSATNRCEYCVAHHSEALSRYVKDSGVVDDLQNGRASDRLDPREKRMVAYAVKLTNAPYMGTKEDIESLREVGLSDKEILQTVMVASYFNFVNRLANGLGVQLEKEGGKGYNY